MRKALLILISIAVFILLLLPGRSFAGRITGLIKVKGLRSPANVLVYLRKAPPVTLDLSDAKFVMDQRNLTFIPHVLPILVGTEVHFPNNDKVNHNIFSLSRAKKFNLGSYKPGESRAVLFDKPGIVELRCDVHAEMAAYIMVMKNPYWAITDNKGRFEIPDQEYLKRHGMKGIKDLPPGKYFIRAWHEKLKTVKERLEIPKNGEVSLQLNLTRGVPGVLYK